MTDRMQQRKEKYRESATYLQGNDGFSSARQIKDG
jgi:hypothetical protein